MGNITLENNLFVYTTDNEKKILLDCNDYLANKSRVPMHAPVADFALPAFLNNLHQVYGNLFVEGHSPNDGDDYFLIDILLANQLIQTAHPVKVAELGCTNGRLSYHLASVLGRFHQDSSLCCVCDSIGNESGNFWLDMISLVEISPKLSMLASDYDDTNLCNNHFDVVIMNGSVPFANTEAVVKEAKKLVKSNGIIICYAWRQPELADDLKKAFSSVDAYSTNDNTYVLVADATNEIEERDEIAEWKKEFQHDFVQAETHLVNCTDKKELLHSIQQLNLHADIATSNRMTDIKCKSLELKEKLLIKYIEL